MSHQELLTESNHSKPANNQFENLAKNDSTNHAGKLLADVNSNPEAFKHVFTNTSKIPAGYENNAPTIDFGKQTSGHDTKPFGPQEATQDRKHQEHRIEQWPQNEPKKLGSDNENKNHKPGIQLPEGINKNPIGDIPKRYLENPNPPKLGQPRDDGKQKPGDKSGTGDSPKFIDFPALDPKNPWWIMNTKK